MMTALDTNILSAIWSREPSTELLVPALQEAKRAGTLVLSPPAYAECLAHPFFTEEQIEQLLADAGIEVQLSLLNTVWIEAGRRYRQYALRRRQSRIDPPRRLLADFLIGAHALLQAEQLLTLDLNFYRTYFPELRLFKTGNSA